jgi:hypothetical protein
MQPGPSAGGVHHFIPGDWQPTPDSPRGHLSLRRICFSLKLLGILADTGNSPWWLENVASSLIPILLSLSVRVLEFLAICVQRRIVSWSPLASPGSGFLMEGTAARALSFLGIAAESLLKNYLILKVLVWLGFRVSVPFSYLFEWVLVILLSVSCFRCVKFQNIVGILTWECRNSRK